MTVQMPEQTATEVMRVSTVKPRRADGDLVQSLMRALTLLEILSDQPCRLTELARRASLPPSTTHRLLTTLEQKRFVRFDREESRWTVGSPPWARLCWPAARSHALAAVCPPAASSGRPTRPSST